MSAEHLVPSGKPSRPNEPRVTPTSGRIARILIGQGHGFIRLRDGREIYFHRGDVRNGTAFNDLRIGDTVALEVLEDLVSGARALRVVGRKPIPA